MLIFHSKKTPRVTVVGKFDPTENKLYLSAARTSRKDAFCRETGRDVAGKRLSKGEYTSVIPVNVSEIDKPAIVFVDYAKIVAERVANNARRITKSKTPKV